MWHLITVFVATILVIWLVLQRRGLYLATIRWFKALGKPWFVWPISIRDTIEMSARNPSPLIYTIGKFGVVRTAEHVRILLNSPHCQDKAMFYRFLWVDQGVFASPTHIWKQDRKAFTPAFGAAMLPKLEVIFNEKIILFVQLLQEHVGKERNIFMDIGRCFIDTIMVTAFGVELGLQQDPLGRIWIELQHEFEDLTLRRIYMPLLWPDCFYKFHKYYARQREILKIGNDILDRILQEHAEKNRVLNDRSPKKFIDKLLELHNMKYKPDPQYLREHLLTIILAGSDTSMITVANALLMLAIHQDIQEHVYQELMAVIGTDQNKPITQEDAANMTYMEMVCKETLRLFPVGGLIGRKTTADIVLDENTTIRANTNVLLNLFKLHRDPEIWGPTAADFDPERFQPELAGQRHPYAYLPFSGGPRMCLGVRYAWFSMKIMLGHVLRRYRLKTSLTMETVKIHYSMLMRIKQGCQISLEER